MGRPHYKLQPRLETIALAPNLWYPEGNPNKQKSDTSFYDALDLPILRESILGKFLPEQRFPRQERYSWHRELNIYASVQDYFDLIFQDGRFDITLANYRLDIMQSLRSNPQVRQGFEYLFNGLAQLAHREEDRKQRDSMQAFLKKGKVYCDLITEYKPFPSDAPQGLQQVNQHMEAVCSSPAYRKLDEIVAKTQNGFHLQMTWRCHGFMKDDDCFKEPLSGKEVVSAAILPLDEKVNEFGDSFRLGIYGRSSGYDSRNPINEIVSHTIEVKFKRHFANASEQMNQTLSLFPQIAVYLADLHYMENQEKNGVHYSRPVFLAREEGRASFKNVHHPLVTERTTSVGNPIDYNPLRNISVITGPNKGGKSVYVKCVGIAHARGLKGFFVPAECAEFSERDGIYTHFIRQEDITQGESRFSDEMKRMESIFAQATPYSLVLLDEPCGGTTLSAGEIKTQEFLEVFGELGCPIFITTHMEGIAKKITEGIIPKSLNKHLSFSNSNGKIDYYYTLVDGAAQMDYGAQIADSLGLGADNLRQRLRARAQKEGFKLGK